MSATSDRNIGQSGRVAFRREPEFGRVPEGSEAEKRLREIWEGEPGWRGFITTVDHKKIGLRYIVTAFIFLMIGGAEALLMRLQLARPNETLLSPEQYAQLFTMHGVTMIFLYALPVLSGFANFLWPLMLGSRDMAFPRLNALSYWVFLFAGVFLYCSFPFGEAPNAGWFNYVPFSSLEYNRGPNIDVYSLGMVLLGISTSVGAVNFVVTLFRMRAVGMSVDRLPIIVWGTLTISFANLLAVPAVSLAFFLLWMDRNIGTHFFDVAADGRPLLWQHLFWMFAHPWVYVVVLPAMGIVSDALPTFSRRPLVAYAAVAMSTVATMIIGFEVWIHHMFATGIAPLALAFFGAASVLISIPSAVAVFAWIATMWTGRPVFTVPFLYFASFVLMFVVGGVSGVMTAAVPLDWQLNETYFVVAHLHYVLLGINVFPVLGGITYWFPKFTGRLMNEPLGKIAFWIVFVGFNLGFFPMHISGLLGMPRRIYTYPEGMGWDTSNLITTIGSFLLAIGVLLFAVNALVSARRGRKAPPNPWDAPGLEWSVASPPPPYNFAVLPIVESRHPMWEDRLQPSGRHSSLEQGYLLHQGRESLGVHPFTGKPDVILKMPDDAWSPFFLGLFAALMFLGLLLRSPSFAALSFAACGATLIAWMWPRRSLAQREPPTPKQTVPARTVEKKDVLPVGSAGEHSGGWWGVLALVVTEASLFGYLIFSYFYSQSQTQMAWPPEGMPKIGVGGLSTGVLILSSVFAWLAERTLRKSRKWRAFAWMIGAIVLGCLFVGIQLKEWHDHPYGITAHLYGSLYYTITGFHLAHVLVGLVILVLLALWIALGYFDAERNAPMRIGGLYWHFVDVVWLFIFTSLYVTPFWLRGQ
ncbi:MULTISPECIES: cytochrome c oxidase subunit I [unclassified Caballeronia]|uniref:cytochrome c oxidase subunit I n=1 Tax=unclassified Caballeronia TaxID=2646786 RepID=UPI00285856B9|nr:MULTISPECIES: cytochrome c oxidase subunit I [unclassified Caballeronia]MDR5752897.1 cytochrome c oxidase subunit I [Caballeronia sp. LZ024]MDR5845617.1 cytochrome c oxidase subunit I [Caballeronia sp. LZ031]